tara:strand:+ start:582 stop:896 length:315 start_codon:yes stop_codon:yes gene_type:complete
MAVGPNKRPARKRIQAGSTGAKYIAAKAKAGKGRMTAKDVEKAGKAVGMKKGGKMAKGYAKGGAKMMKAMGGKMAKGYAKGGAKMSVAGLRAQAKKMGYKITKG